MDDTHNEKMLNPESWPNGIRVKRYFFRANGDKNENSNNKNNGFFSSGSTDKSMVRAVAINNVAQNASMECENQSSSQ